MMSLVRWAQAMLAVHELIMLYIAHHLALTLLACTALWMFAFSFWWPTPALVE